MKVKVQETMAILAVLTILVGLPAAVWYYEAVWRVAAFGEDTQVITLTGISDGGVWTTEAVGALGYSYRKFDKPGELRIDPTRPVVFRVRSADVLHSFSLPALHIYSLDVHPGREITLRLEPEDLEDEPEIDVVCWRVCGEEHRYMAAKLRLKTEANASPTRR